MRCKQERAIYYQQKILETLLPIPHSPFPIPKKRQPFGHISNKTAIPDSHHTNTSRTTESNN